MCQTVSSVPNLDIHTGHYKTSTSMSVSIFDPEAADPCSTFDIPLGLPESEAAEGPLYDGHFSIPTLE